MINELKRQRLDAKLIISMHDEMQFRVHSDIVEDVKTIGLESAVLAGEFYKLNVPILADAKIGSNWAECH